MKALNQLIAGFFVLVIGATLTVSCGGDGGPETCQPEDYVGTWVGRYSLQNLIPLDYNDTLIISVTGNIANITSKLATSTFQATYDAETGDMTIGTFTSNEFLVGNDTLFDVTVESGMGLLRSDCSTLFINLENLSIQDGTINFDIIGGYPVENVDVSTQSQKPFKKI